MDFSFRPIYRTIGEREAYDAIISYKKLPHTITNGKVSKWEHRLQLDLWLATIRISWTRRAKLSVQGGDGKCRCHGGWDRRFNVAHRFDCPLFSGVI